MPHFLALSHPPIASASTTARDRMARSIVLLCVCLARSAAALRVPFGKAKSAVPPPPPEPTAPWEAPLLKAVAAPYFAYPAAIVQSRAVIESVFGTPSTTFEDNLREPAAIIHGHRYTAD